MSAKLIFASHNQNKTKEIAAILNGLMKVVSLDDIGFTEEIEEWGSTLEENARIKASTIFDATALNCFADDSGLMVEALNGAPGVYSARYAGEEKDPKKNNEKLLLEMNGRANRNARFETVICLYLNGKVHFFKGILEGTIGFELRGNNGFGYDPLFIPLGSDLTLAQMDLEEKNGISHRAEALKKMYVFLQEELKVNC